MKKLDKECIRAPEEYGSPVGMCMLAIVAFATYIVASITYFIIGKILRRS